MDKATFENFRHVKDSLCLNSDGTIILKETQIVIPAALQNRVIELAHEGHQGVNKTKAFLRSKVWFPRMNEMVEATIQHCIPCQVNSRRNYEPLKMSELPAAPWLNVSMDFCGPLPSGDYLLVMIDEYSRYPVVEIVRNMNTEKIIPIVDKIFSLFGFPKILKTDNGPQFISRKWKEFMNACGIEHRKITPLWPKANSQAEGFNKPLMKSVRAAHIQRKNWKQEIYNFCRMYRTTPHITTQYTPHFLMFGRIPRTKLPEAFSNKCQEDKNVRRNDNLAKWKMKINADIRNKARASDLRIGDKVLIMLPKVNKLSSKFNPIPLTVTRTKGSMVTAQRPDGSLITRNSSFFRRLPSDIKKPSLECQEYADEFYEDSQFGDTRPEAEQQNLIGSERNQVEVRRSTRVRRPPAYLKDYVHYASVR